MTQLSRIETRLTSLSELDELVRALRSMAAGRAREAQEAFQGTRAYCGIIERAIAGIAPLVDMPGQTAGDGGVLLVVSSENGFVGGFNNRLIEKALTIRKLEERLVIIGRRGEAAARERGSEPDQTFPMASHVAGITPLARRIASGLKASTSARIVFARYLHGASYEITVKPVLPLEPSRPAHGTTPAPPLHHLPVERLLRDLSTEYLFAEIAHALMESHASENGARLQTMESASQNIDSKIDELKREERIARQEETTSDMLDVVIGAEAVSRR
jgi:F-type H+-transporting ATPase subunit gamma